MAMKNFLQYEQEGLLMGAMLMIDNPCSIF